MDSLLQDLRFAVRTLRRSPWFTLVSVLTLALGIGVNAAMWSVADAVLYRDLPYEKPEELVVVWQSSPKVEIGPLAIPTYRDLEERHRSFEALTAFIPQQFNLSQDVGEPERVQGLMVSEGFLDLLGVQPIQGPGFLAEDHRFDADRTVMLSHRLWQRRFAGGEVIGQQLRLDQQTYRIVGVLPSNLRGEGLGGATFGDLLLPMAIFRSVLPYEDRAQRPGLRAVGRLESRNLDLATEDLQRISLQLQEENPMIFSETELQCESIRDFMVRDDRQTLFLLLGAVALVLIIACANLINLQLSRLARREPEMATRWALGAEPGRLLRQINIENLVLGLVGGGVGLVFASASIHAIPSLLGAHWAVDGLSLWVLVVSLLVSALAGILVGLLPAARIVYLCRQDRFSKMQMRSSLPNKVLRQVLVGLEVAFALTTLIWAGLLLVSLNKLGQQDPGFSADGRLTFRMMLPQSQFDEVQAWMTLLEQAEQRLLELPGISQVAVTSLRPLTDGGRETIVAAGDRALTSVSDLPLCVYQMVSPSYFDTLGIPLVEGRGLLPSDDDRRGAERVVVISESLARAFWPETSPIDQRIAFEFLGTPRAPEPQWRRVVGVVSDLHLKDLSQPPKHAVFTTYSQIPLWYTQNGATSPAMGFVIQSPGENRDALPGVRALFQELAPGSPIFQVRDLQSSVDAQLIRPRRAAQLIATFSAFALVLVLVGVLGVVSYVVTARTREIGIRMAVGAAPRSVAWMFLKQTLFVSLLGLTLGTLISIGFSRLISSLLFGVEPIDPLTYGGAALSLLLVTLVATCLPALRASRIRPLEALRED